MAEKRRNMGLLERRKDWIFYGLVLVSFFGLLASWRWLPEVVLMSVPQAGKELVTLPKVWAMSAHFLLSVGFAFAFWLRPKQVIFFLASILGLFLTFGILYLNLSLGI